MRNEIEIEVWEDAPDPAAFDWRATVPGKKKSVGPAEGELDFDALLDENHHRQYGRPWSIGRSHFDYLVEIGLAASDRVLDFGCGAGRVGIWLIGYLEPERYFCVDSHRLSLEAFARYEIPLHGLAPKRPRLAHDAAFGFASFGVTFDWVLDLFVSAHLPGPLVPTLYTNIAEVLAEGGRVVVPHAPILDADTLARIGLRLDRVDERPALLLDRSARGFAATDNFHVLVKG